VWRDPAHWRCVDCTAPRGPARLLPKRGSGWSGQIWRPPVPLFIGGFALGFGAIFSDAGELPTWATVTNWAVTVLVVPLHATLMAAVYMDFRIRQEGYDIQVAAVRLPGAA
jgi:hypothetical protein